MMVLALWGREAQSQLVPVLGAQRAGTASLQFLKIGVGARAAGMGESFIAVANDATALYWNPAGITQFADDQIVLSHTNWLVDVRHQFLGAVFHLTPDDVVGISVTSLHTDDMPVTTEVQPFGNGQYFRFGDLAVGVSYGRRMTSQFSFGGTIRYVEETLDAISMRGFVVDVGTYYWTGLGTSRFSAVVSNFGNQQSPNGTVSPYGGPSISQFQEFSPPTAFKFGFAFEPMKDESDALTLALQLNHPNDNSENLSFGAEYLWSNTLFLRGGYKLNVDEQSFSGGLGLFTSIDALSLNVDYGYSAFTTLGGVHRVSLLVKL